jgi:hypothetical protein
MESGRRRLISALHRPCEGIEVEVVIDKNSFLVFGAAPEFSSSRNALLTLECSCLGEIDPGPRRVTRGDFFGIKHT